MSIYARRITALERLRAILESPFNMPVKVVNEKKVCILLRIDRHIGLDWNPQYHYKTLTVRPRIQLLHGHE